MLMRDQRKCVLNKDSIINQFKNRSSVVNYWLHMTCLPQWTGWNMLNRLEDTIKKNIMYNKRWMIRHMGCCYSWILRFVYLFVWEYLPPKNSWCKCFWGSNYSSYASVFINLTSVKFWWLQVISWLLTSFSFGYSSIR